MPQRPSFTPLKLTLTYASIGAAWIIGSDSFVAWRESEPFVPSILHTGKGLAFIVVTSLALYYWARRFYAGTINENQALAEARQRVEQSRRLYATLSAVNRRIIRPTDRQTLCQDICNVLIEPGGFKGAWIARLDSTRSRIVSVAHAGPPPPAELGFGGADGSDAEIVRLLEVMKSGQPALCQRFQATQGPLAALRQACDAQSCASIPFRPDDGEPMTVIVYSGHPDFFSTEVVNLLTELAVDLESGIETITMRERRTSTEAALRLSEERYRLLAENSQDVIWILSLDIRVQYISPSIERLLGYKPAEMFDMDLSRFLTPPSCERARRELEEGMTELRTTGNMRSRLLELEQVRKDGTTVWTEINTTLFQDGSKQQLGVLGVTRDISSRREAQQALAREVARCRALLDVSVDAIHVVDDEGRLLEANEIFLRERGYRREDMPTLRAGQWNAEYNAEQIRAKLAGFGSEPVLFETVHRRGDGTLFAVEARAKRVEVDGHSLIYITARDITERRTLEQRLLRAQRLESVGLIASGIAHDLNNVLTPILLSTGLLEMRYGTAEDQALLKPIEQAARRGSNIVQQILTFARGAEGERVSVEPKLLLKELINLIRETFPRNIVHRLEVAPDTSPLSGDPTQLHQVFLNLAVNARDAMPNGGTLTIDVRDRRLTDDAARLIPSAKPGNYVCVTVADTGTGMTPDVLDHLFEPFFTTKPRGRGTGLGLSTVHGLVRSHGGFVEVNSQLGRGSEFRVFLPAAPLNHPLAAAKEKESPKQLGHGEHILIADDEPAILTVLSSVLRRNGFVPLTAADGDEALTLLDQHVGTIAVVITDVMMPRFDGVRLATEVRRHHENMPIIAMSGMISPTPDDDSRAALRELGVTAILDKPYSEPEMLKAIEAALKTRTK